MIHLTIDKQSSVSIHQQIVEQICALIDRAVLRGGDRLPTERALCERYGVSRGTVKAAYLELARMGRVQTIQGSGTYIAQAHVDLEQRYIRSLLSGVLHEAEEAGLSGQTVLSLLRQEVSRRARHESQVRVAWVGCCREVLRLSEPVLSDVPIVQLESFLLSEVVRNPALLGDDYDLIVTTEGPYDALLHAIEDQADKIERITLCIDSRTSAQIAKLRPDQRVLLYGMDALYMEVMYAAESVFSHIERCRLVAQGDAGIEAALAESDVLLLPDRHILFDQPEMLAAAQAFAQAGKPVIDIAYHVDRGSVLHFETVVRQCHIEKCRYGIAEPTGRPESFRQRSRARAPVSL